MGRLFRLLKADEIEVKVKQVKEKGAVALIYKTSRVDMDILDETLGAMNWTTDYKEIKGNLYCGIGIRTSADKPFVWKWDCGIESREDDEGNEKKGEASDAFKRAGTKVGIARELYSSPFIFLNVGTELDDKYNNQGNNKKKVYKLSDPFESYSVSKIEYDANDKISALEIVNGKGQVVYTYPKGNTGASKPAAKPQTSPTAPKTAPKTDDKPTAGGKLTKTEMCTVWGVKNVEETLTWLERKIGYIYQDWTDEEHETARGFLRAEKQRRKAEVDKMRQGLQQAAVETPFDVGD